MSDIDLGTMLFQPFEVIAGKKHGLFKTQIWQVAATFYYALFGMTPYSAVMEDSGLYNMYQMKKLIKNNILYYEKEESLVGTISGKSKKPSKVTTQLGK
jgi:serine/threonine protein kinase